MRNDNDGSVASGDSTVNNNPSPDTKQNRAAPRGFRQWTHKQKIAVLGIVVPAIAVIAAAAIAIIPPSLSGHDSGSGRSSGALPSSGASLNQVRTGTNYGSIVVGGGTIINYGPTASSTGLSSNPQARIVELTGSYTEQGFVDAIIDRETNIVALYLKTGMTAATLHEGASAILFGFQGVPQNGDPIALIKTFQAGGFKVDDQLKDSYLMGKLTDNLFPSIFDTNLTPTGYTGGYEGGWFVGSLLFWIVQLSTANNVGGQNLEVMNYLINQGADCKIPLSYLKYSISENQIDANSPITKEMLSMMQRCAK